MYLPLLAGLDWAGRYNWDSACLTHLYREMCRTIYPTSKKWEDVHCCYSFTHGITCRSFNQGSSANRHIYLQIGKKIISLKQSSFSIMYLTLTYHISLDGVTEAQSFPETHAVMS